MSAGMLDQASAYLHFFDDAEFEETERPGFRRRVILGEHLELWFWRITGGAGGSVLHHHTANEQLGIIMRGALDFRIGERDDPRRHVLHAGDVYLAPFTVWHGDSVFVGDEEMNEVWILDVFAPPRTVATVRRADPADRTDPAYTADPKDTADPADAVNQAETTAATTTDVARR